MGGFLSNLSFLQPVILLAFISLPLLWLILRITPPPPKQLRIPTFRFIKELTPESNTSKDTPLWLLLLRLLAISAIILGFAGPVLNAQSTLKGQLKPRIIIDNSWAGAANWDAMIAKASAIAEEAGHAGLDVRVMLLADDIANRNWQKADMSAKEALARIKTLEPQSWPADYKTLKDSVVNENKSYQTYLLSSGIKGVGFEDLNAALVNLGGLDVFVPVDSALPFSMKSDDEIKDDAATMTRSEGGIYATLEAFSASQTKRALTVNALDNSNSILDRVKIAPNEWVEKNDRWQADIHFDLPAKLVAKVQRLQLSDQRTAASTLIVDPAHARKNIGLVHIKGEKDNKAYIGAGFYLTRALAPYADITEGVLSDVLTAKPDVIILPDDIAAFPEQLNALQEWLDKGGILIRFAGPRLLESAQGNASLLTSLNQYLPVTLRRGGRSMGGELSWESAMELQDFAEDSLFYGLSLNEDIKIKTMVLAEPGEYLDTRTWARLKDGTPIVTFNAYDNGLIILFHTAATPDWSTLPLSGLYVEMLKRLIDLSAMPREQRKDIGNRERINLNPIYTLNGYGQVQSPSSAIKPIKAILENKNIQIGLSIPPGLYAGQGLSKTINLGEHLNEEKIILNTDLPNSASMAPYQSSKEERPGSLILYIALLLLLADLAACFLFLGKSGTKAQSKLAHIILPVLFTLGFCLSFAPSLAQAQDYNPREMAEYANNFYLAYIKSPDENLNDRVQTGLEELGMTLNMRTSAEPTGIVALNVENDELSFFPLIYWPVTAGQNNLPAKTMDKIQHYLDNGGMILFDLQNSQSLDGGNSNGDLRQLIGHLNIAPLEMVPEEHALRRSFYLLDEFPGDIPDNPLWVEKKEDTRIADAGSVLIGSNRWADAWARGAGSERDEMAMRFGVNLVMYALTGNYKTDQVHVKHILERLGE